jgi:hypothetical protein
MATKDELIQWLEDSHQQITDQVNLVDPNKEIYPGWTIREVLAHFAGWDTAVVASIKSHVAGLIPSVVAGGDHNAYNADTIKEQETLSFEQIYQKWQQTHEHLKIVIRELPSEKMEGEFIFPWGQTGKIEDLVVGLTSDHESIHMKDVETLIRKEK